MDAADLLRLVTEAVRKSNTCVSTPETAECVAQINEALRLYYGGEEAAASASIGARGMNVDDVYRREVHNNHNVLGMPLHHSRKLARQMADWFDGSAGPEPTRHVFEATGRGDPRERAPEPAVLVLRNTDADASAASSEAPSSSSRRHRPWVVAPRLVRRGEVPEDRHDDLPSNEHVIGEHSDVAWTITQICTVINTGTGSAATVPTRTRTRQRPVYRRAEMATRVAGILDPATDGALLCYAGKIVDFAHFTPAAVQAHDIYVSMRQRDREAARARTRAAREAAK